MLTFEVNDMTCGHCVSSITKAVVAVDHEAKVTADLATKRVHISAAHANAQALTEAMTDAGFTPVQIQAGA
jgi:copper chaperone